MNDLDNVLLDHFTVLNKVLETVKCRHEEPGLGCSSAVELELGVHITLRTISGTLKNKTKNLHECSSIYLIHNCIQGECCYAT